ncbi:hypothetical protein MMC26_005641 [Xylographa opegraphella]|nr:hypothetical protein [Xylographa opegraphella]
MSSFLNVADNVSGADPTGFLSAGVAAIKLVGAVAKVAPHVKHAVDNFQNNHHAAAGPQTLNRSVTVDGTTAPVSLQVDPEREARAYETVNYVLRTLGQRIGEAGLVSGPALTKALTAASTHIEVELFSVNANRLFQSLSKKLADAILVNSVFTSIYFIGAITAELSSSLPNYKQTYPPLGPYIIQQIFRAAIGEDAFRENLTANLDAYKTLATTAGLLRPTDIGYSIFPNFPSLTPTRYSSKSFTDVRNHKNIFNKLIQHFDFHGFPQPLMGRDAGPIKDWRFLSGDSNTRFYDVEKADKHIGEAMGRVLYWLITSAERMPAGMAVIAYYKQHIELINWMGTKFGFCVLNGAKDLDLKGPHLRLDNKYRATIEAWVIIMPSQSAQLSRQHAIKQWNQAQPPSPISMQPSTTSTSNHRMSVASSVSSVDIGGLSASNLTSSTDAGGAAPARSVGIGAVITHAGHATRRTGSYPRPASHAVPAPQSTVSSPGPTTTQGLTGQPMSPSSTPTMMASPTSQSATASAPISPSLVDHSAQSFSPSNQAPIMLTPSFSASSNSPLTSSASYFPSPSAPSPAPLPSEPLATKRPASMIRRKAPPPPRKFTPAIALYDFAPEDEGGEELIFHEGDDIEIVEKSEELENDGWCKARVKGNTKVGLAPLEYLKEVAKPEVKQQHQASATQAPFGSAMPNSTGHRSASMPMTAATAAKNSGASPGGVTSLQNAGTQNGSGSRNLDASRGTRSVSGVGTANTAFQPQLSGIYEAPAGVPKQQIHMNQQNLRSRPASVSVHSSQVPSAYGVSQGSTGTPSQGSAHTPNNHQVPEFSQNGTGQGPQSPSNHPLPHTQSTNARPTDDPHATASQISTANQSNSSVNPSVTNRRPSAAQHPALTQANLAAQQNTNPGRPPTYTTIAGPSGNTAQSNSTGQDPSGITFSPTLALNLNPQRISRHHQHVHQHGSPNQTQGLNNSTSSNVWSNPSNNQNSSSNNTDPSMVSDAGYPTYTANVVDPSTGMYSSAPTNFNFNTTTSNAPSYANPSAAPGMYQAPGYGYDPNTMMNVGPTYVNAPTYYSGDDGGLDPGLLVAGMGIVASQGADPISDSGQDPASFMNTATDLASIDPFYAATNPGFTSVGPGTPTSFQSATADPFGASIAAAAGLGSGDASPLAGLGFNDSTTSLNATSETNAGATDSPSLDTSIMQSPLAGLAGGIGSSTNPGLGLDPNASGLVSPLAGLAIVNTSSTSLQMSSEQTGDGTSSSFFANQSTFTEQQQATSFTEVDTDSNGNQSMVYTEQDTTVTQQATCSDFGDDSDDGFGYS